MDRSAAKMSRQVERALREARGALAGHPVSAAEQASAIIAGDPDNSRAYRLLAAALRRLGRYEEAGHADVNAVQASARSPTLLDAAKAMRDKQVETAERLLRSYLETDPDDPQALRMLAEIAAVCGHGGDAERLLRKALEEVPGFVPLYVNLATLLHDVGRTDDAIALLDQVLASAPGNSMVLSFKAGILGSARRMAEALDTEQALLTRAPDVALAWINHANTLQAVGRLDDAVSAYRTSLKLDPASGFAWWGLAKLKTIKLDEQDIAAMQQALAGATDDLNRVRLHFALGKALGDEKKFEESFRHYALGNDLRKILIPYDPQQVSETVRKAETVFTCEFLQKRAGQGSMAADPIFIIGMPRSGSTLVEQILASHPLIEGADELFDMDRIAAGITNPDGTRSSWLDAIGDLSAESLRALGESYLSSTRVHRKTGRPFFTDKMPYNWSYAGLIHLILPKAKIIDVRRHPLGCCFSNFTLYFNRTTNFASGLEDIGRYYRAYVRMMDHFDRIVPGRVHRVLYEDLVGDLEGEVRKLLDHLGLPFDEACLRFHENPRAVHTPSAQQVRRQINSEGLQYWRNYEPWLDPLKESLGPVLDLYPAVPSD